MISGYRRGTLRAGKIYLFNAGSLLHQHGAFMRPQQPVLQQLREAVSGAHAQLGVYVQEHLIHPKALVAVIAMVNQHPDVFSFGMCLSPINGFCHAPEVGVDPMAPIGAGEVVDTGLGLQKWAGRNGSGNWFNWFWPWY